MTRSIRELDDKDPAAFALLLEVVRTELEWRAAEVREAAAREACRRAATTFVISEAGNQAKAAYWAAMRGAFEAKSAHEAALAKVTL